MAAARNALGVVALKRGDTAGAEREIRQAIAGKADVRLAHFNLALLADERGQPQAAIAEYAREIELHPNTSYSLDKIWQSCMPGSKDRNAQADAYRHAIDVNPGFAEGHLYLAKLYLDLGARFDDALALARKGIELAPESEYAPLGHYVIADIYSRQGRRPGKQIRKRRKGARSNAGPAGRAGLAHRLGIYN